MVATTGLGTGGAEAMLLKVLSHLEHGRFSVHVVSAMDEGTSGSRIRELGFDLTCLGLNRPVPSIASFLRLRRAVRDFRPHVIQGWMYHGNFAAWLAKKLAPGTPALAWGIRHCVYDLKNEKRMTAALVSLGARLSHKVDATIYASTMSLQQHVGLGYSDSGAIHIPNGFDLSRFKRDERARSFVRTSLRIPNDAFVVGHVARQHPMKDHENFLRAAALVAKCSSDTFFVLAGREIDYTNAALSRLVADSGLTDRVRLLGERRDVPELMASFDAYCLSSWSESFPNVVGEAAATALPCVVTDVGAARDIVGEYGFVAPPRDPEKLAAAILDVIRLPLNERQALGLRLRDRVVSRFSIDDVAAQYAQTWESLATRAEFGARAVAPVVSTCAD